jgi:hypothetical protein
MRLQRGLEDRLVEGLAAVPLVEVDPPCFPLLLYTVRCFTFKMIQI